LKLHSLIAATSQIVSGDQDSYHGDDDDNEDGDDDDDDNGYGDDDSESHSDDDVDNTYNNDFYKLLYCRSEKEATFVLKEMRANVENASNLEENNSRQREISVPDPSPRKSSTSSVHNSIKVFLPLLLIIFI